MNALQRVILYTDSDGRARFREEPIELNQGTAAARLSELFAAQALQWRFSPVGFRSEFHCTATPQWLIVISGCMEIELQDGTCRRFNAGEHFYSGDTLPDGCVFDPSVHGHRSRQIGDQPLVTVFVRG